MTLTWEAITGLCAVLALICALNGLYVQYAIRRAIDDLFVRLNGRYVGSTVCVERHGEHARRLDALEDRDA